MLRGARMAGLAKLRRGIDHVGQGQLWAGHVGRVRAERRKSAIVQAVGMHRTQSSDHFGQMSPKSAKQTARVATASNTTRVGELQSVVGARL